MNDTKLSNIERDLSKKFSDDLHSMIVRTYDIARAGGVSQESAIIMLSATLMDQAIETICVISRNKELMIGAFTDRAEMMITYHNKHSNND